MPDLLGGQPGRDRMERLSVEHRDGLGCDKLLSFRPARKQLQSALSIGIVPALNAELNVMSAVALNFDLPNLERPRGCFRSWSLLTSCCRLGAFLRSQQAF